MLGGQVAPAAAPWLAGAPIHPIRKRGDPQGVRPIAVGEVFRRLVSRACCAVLRQKTDEFFLARKQVEAAVQALRREQDRAAAESREWVVLRVDLENSFNSVSRGEIEARLKEHFPELVRWFRFCYAEPARLFCQSRLLPFGSAAGVQQGDPLGPFLFALALAPCNERLIRELGEEALSVWYLDDGTIAGPREVVLRAWGIIVEECGFVNLRLKFSKCELFTTLDGVDFSGFPEEIRRLGHDGFELLGTPIGNADFSEECVGRRVERISESLEKLSILNDPQCELLLLRACLGMPRFGFALRSVSPSLISGAISEFDLLIDARSESCFGLSLPPLQTIQWPLPIGLGGAGVIKASTICNAAYLGNVLGSLETVQALLGRPVDFVSAPEVADVFPALLDQVGDGVLPPNLADLPTCELFRQDDQVVAGGEQAGAHGDAQPRLRKRVHHQRLLSELIHAESQRTFLATESPSHRETLRRLAVCRPDAGKWLGVLPVRALGLSFPKHEFGLLLRWWLGLEVGCEGVCPERACGQPLDRFGDHSVLCASGPSRIARHDGVNHTWVKTLQSSGFHCRIEAHLDPGTRHRSADTLVFNWRYGRDCAHDWVVTHTLQQNCLNQADPNRALTRSEAYKVSYAKARCEERGIEFLALALDTFGGFGAGAKGAMKRVAEQAKLCREDDDLETNARRIASKLQVVGMRGVARQLGRRLPVVTEEEEREALEEW